MYLIYFINIKTSVKRKFHVNDLAYYTQNGQNLKSFWPFWGQKD